MPSRSLQDIVLPTKLHRPQPRDHDVLRPRLLTHLDAGLQQRVTLVSAPAGFGKTVLAAQWLEHLPRRAAWLSLDEQDSDLERFLRYLIAALHPVAPGLCAEVEPLLAVPTLPPAAYVADALVAALLALSEPVVLVLDDYHAVRSDEVHTMLMRLVQHQPAAVHLVILTRVDPPWPLARWRVRQWLSELRAADLCFSPEEALRHLLAAGEVDGAAALVERHFRALIDDGVHSGKDLERWVALFPPAAVSQQPALLVAQAYQHLFQWDSHRIEALLDQADALLQDPACILSDASRQSLRGDIATIYGSCLYQKGDMDGVVRHAQHTRQVRPRENGFTYLAYALSGRRDEALRLLAHDLAADAAQGSRHTGRLLTIRMIIEFYAGDLVAVEQSAQQMLALQDTVAIPDWWGIYGPYFLGRVAYERNVLDTAAAHVARVEAMRYRVPPLLYHDSLLGLALIAQARGEAATLRHYAAVTHAFALKSRNAYIQAASETFAVRLRLYAGDRSGTLPAHAPPLDTNQFWFEILALTLAEYLVSTASAEDSHAAFTAVADGLQRAQQQHTRQIIQFQAVHALALHRAGRPEAVGPVLDQALHLAEPLGLVRTFVDRGPLMAELLQASVQRHPQDPYRRRLVQALGGYHPSGSGTTPLEGTSPGAITAGGPAEATPCELLTNREIEVLRMLQERLSNKEIAARLFVSAETVKKHTLSLYRKLCVHGRRQAVATARQRNLLSSD